MQMASFLTNEEAVFNDVSRAVGMEIAIATHDVKGDYMTLISSSKGVAVPVVVTICVAERC